MNIDRIIITDEHFAAINTAKTRQQASSVCGGYYTKIAYINRVFGPRAIGGRFYPTEAEVRAKFAAAWEAAKR